MERIAALDLASTLGHAYVWPGAEVSYGSHRIAKKGASDGAFFDDYRVWLEGFLFDATPEVVVFESPYIPRGASRSITVTKRLVGLCAITDMVCRQHRIPKVYEVSHQSVKKFFAGSGRAQKADMIHRAKVLGFDPQDDNVADALGVLAYGLSILYGREIAEFAPRPVKSPYTGVEAV